MKRRGKYKSVYVSQYWQFDCREKKRTFQHFQFGKKKITIPMSYEIPRSLSLYLHTCDINFKNVYTNIKIKMSCVCTQYFILFTRQLTVLLFNKIILSSKSHLLGSHKIITSIYVMRYINLAQRDFLILKYV